MEETEDPADVLDAKVSKLVEWIKESSHFIAFTGAGISTSAGISDFRGPNVYLPMLRINSQGVWTRKAQGKQPVSSKPTTSAYPTACHMSLVTLQNKGLLKYIISQNCDGRFGCLLLTLQDYTEEVEFLPTKCLSYMATVT